ncbi:hypothetical protein [Magnetospirillum sp. 15-1]|uniref:hypothetical protein n=1 Tax=Magnetospirillum sp. 15-1 TaxID=1979370 RepID=UPI0018D53422|nr:hypothetical protein [Magnetospirillum sp. 15-1]
MIGVFFVIYAKSHIAATVDGQTQERTRRSLFIISIAMGIPLAFHTLAELPYAAADLRSGPVQVVEAVGRQWEWTLSRNSFRVGETVEFRVTSADVNHGFGIYDPSMRVVAQTQAMPDYVNTLRHKFQAPGKYTILCLEYCGLAHHAMSTEFEVLP